MSRVIRSPDVQSLDEVFPPDYPDNCGRCEGDVQESDLPEADMGIIGEEENDFLSILRRGG